MVSSHSRGPTLYYLSHLSTRMFGSRWVREVTLKTAMFYLIKIAFKCSQQAGRLCWHWPNPDLWQYVSWMPFLCGLTVVYKISPPLNLASQDIPTIYFILCPSVWEHSFLPLLGQRFNLWPGNINDQGKIYAGKWYLNWGMASSFSV